MSTPRFITSIISAILLLAAPIAAGAFDTSVYADNSVLAQGRWIKISVPADGLYRIPASKLRAWGFSDPSKVVVRGYGARRLGDTLNQNSYIDDLPEVQTEVSSNGIIFYAVGAGEWTEAQDKGHYFFAQNDFANAGYYFVGLRTDGETPRSFSSTNASLVTLPAATSYLCRVQHEVEQTPVPGEAGPLLLGEEIAYTSKRSFKLQTPGAVPDGEAWLQASVVTNLETGGQLSFSFDGNKLETNNTDRVSATSGSYVHGVETLSRHFFSLSDQPKEISEIGLQFSVQGHANAAYVNYITLNYERSLRLPAAGHLVFSTDKAANTIACPSPSALTLLDVTDPLDIHIVEGSATSSALSWQIPGSKVRSFAAYAQGASLPEPKTVGYISAQNLHSHKDLDMVIVAPAPYRAQAERLAAFHAKSEPALATVVVTPEEIYNEFSSGACDVGAIRRYFKMLYDRGQDSGRPLRYAILMARTTLDNRGLSAYAPQYPTIPSWMPAKHSASLSDNTGYCTDDIIAMLDDGSGANMGSDKLSIAIGRIPVTSETDARNIVDKTLEYAEKSKKSAWKHRFMFLADDEDLGKHLEQTELMLDHYYHSGGGNMLPRKIYIDAYDFRNGTYPDARDAMYRLLDEGVVWWNFIGHASPTGWTGENMLSYSDLTNLYLRHWPFIYAATCDFMRLDSRRISGGELLYLERYGGAIGMISAVRPVYITDNGKFTNAIARALSQTGDDGKILTPGEIYRRAKNDIRDDDSRPVTDKTRPISDNNRLRFIFVGDPALPLAMPSNTIRIDSINGIAVDNPYAQPTMAALQKATIAGSVIGPDGLPIETMEGVLTLDIFDAERTVTTNGRGKGKVKNFEDMGKRIYTGSTPVRNGKFCADVAMPSELTQNFRPAAMSLYAYSTSDNTEAVGLFRDFYVYGYDETVAPDKSAPLIESLVLNHSDFRSGDAVNESPMLIARLSDDTGLNMSSAGIGHQMTAILDGNKTFTGLSDYYIPSADGSPSGVLNYPMSALQPGLHTLSLRVWDTSGNAAEKTIDFNVVEGLAPKIYDIYSDANPASTVANFYLSHNQPDNMITVTVTVYNLVGRPIWSGKVSGRSDMFLSVPVSWDLTDNSGHRVGRGIYIYRATITSDGSSFETASRRIAVTSK